MFPHWGFTDLSSIKPLGKKEQKGNIFGQKTREGKEEKQTVTVHSYGSEGEKSENKKEGGDKKVEYECRIVVFLTHLVQKDQESLLEKNYFKDSSPGHDFGFLLGLGTCTLLNSCQDHQFWDLHI